MERFYALISSNEHTHYGFTFDEKLARKTADRIEKEDGVHIDIYEFMPYEEIKSHECTVTLETYGTYEPDGDIQREKWFDVPVDWLEKHLPEGYATLDEFLDDYIWDTALFIYEEALADGVVTNEREV